MLYKRRLFQLKPLLKRVRTFEIGSLETLPGPNKNTWRWPEMQICKKLLVSGFNCSLVWTGSKLLHLWPSTGNQAQGTNLSHLIRFFPMLLFAMNPFNRPAVSRFQLRHQTASEVWPWWEGWKVQGIRPLLGVDLWRKSLDFEWNLFNLHRL